tara:strand:- start:478 stop:927 length:450 start_codon:yes stop_codon:yes gene_type:complete
MLDLESILAEWKEDSKIDISTLAECSKNTPELHAKYLEYHAQTRLRLKKAEFKQKELLKDKYLYYEGKMSKEDIETRGWAFDPYDGLNVNTKNFKEYYYDTDKEIQDSELKIQYLKTIIDTLVEIIDNLKWRHQTISNIIKWRAFDAGM